MTYDSVVQVSGLVPLKPAPFFETFKQSQINFKKLLNSKPEYDIMATLNTT